MIDNSPGLTIKIQDYNLVASQPGLLAKLRELTLSRYSGMNHELNAWERTHQERPVKAKLLLAYYHDILVGWAILSKEVSDFYFNRGWGFNPVDGSMFQVFVHSSYRKMGIATRLLFTAKVQTTDTLCVCPHDEVSRKLLCRPENYQYKEL